MKTRLIVLLGAMLPAGWFGWNAGQPDPASRTPEFRPVAPVVTKLAAFAPPQIIERSDLDSLLARIDSMEAGSLADWAARLASEPGARETLALVVERWAALDPKEAWRFYRSHPRTEFAGPVFLHLTAADPVFAMNCRKQEWGAPDHPDKNYWEMFNAMADVFSRMPSAERTRLTEAHGFALPWAMAEQLARRDGAAAVAFVDSLPYGRGRDYSKQKMFEGLTESDPAKAVAVMTSQGGKWDQVMTNAWQQWYLRDPETSLAWLRSNATGGPPADQAGVLLQSIASKNPEEAMALARGFSGNARVQALVAVAAEIAGRDVSGALALMEEIPESQDRMSTVSRVVTEWSKKDLPAATEWIQRIDAPDYREECFFQIATARSESDPMATLEWALALPPNDLSALTAKIAAMPNRNSWQEAFLNAVPAAP